MVLHQYGQDYSKRTQKVGKMTYVYSTPSSVKCHSEILPQLSARYNDARERNRFCIEVRILYFLKFRILTANA